MAVILTRSIDLSMASNLALTGMIVAAANSACPACRCPLLIAMAAHRPGARRDQRRLVWKLDIPPIVVTLGTLTIFRGLTFVSSPAAVGERRQMSRTSSTSRACRPRPAAALLVRDRDRRGFFVLHDAHAARPRPLRGRRQPDRPPSMPASTSAAPSSSPSASPGHAGLCGYLWVSRYVIASVGDADRLRAAGDRGLRHRRRLDRRRRRHGGPAPCSARCSSASSTAPCR
jgi:rhamnose transport system permease protein